MPTYQPPPPPKKPPPPPPPPHQADLIPNLNLFTYITCSMIIFIFPVLYIFIQWFFIKKISVSIVLHKRNIIQPTVKKYLHENI